MHRGAVLASDVLVASAFGSRLRGLLGRKELAPGEGLLLYPCSSVHTFFMAFPIDVVFLDDDWRVVAVSQGMRPWRLSGIRWAAKAALELPAGIVRHTGTASGDYLHASAR
jgi:uncharacterized membrane protein (UPF0127 family)